MFLGMAQGLYAQTTGPTYDLFSNMNGEVSVVKYILPANTRVNLSSYKDWVAWGAFTKTCYVANDDGNTANWVTQKIGSKIYVQAIQHCHGPYDPITETTLDGVQQVGTASFSWSNGQLFPKKMTDSKWAFHVDHNNAYYIPVTQGVKISVQVFLATLPTISLNPTTAFNVRYFPGWDATEWNYKKLEPQLASRENLYGFLWENNTTPKDHLYTFNITPPFTGTICIKYGSDVAWGVNNTNSAAVWDKAFAMKDGTSTGTVPVGSFVKVPYEQQYYIKFRDNGLLMVPQIGRSPNTWAPEHAPEQSAFVGEEVKQWALNTSNKDQKWYIHPSSTAGYSNIWTPTGALGSMPSWWHARSFVYPILNNPWHQVQFVDQGNGYRKMKLGGKGPAGEDLFLTAWGAVEGDEVSVYYWGGGSNGQDVQLLKADPTGGARYQLQFVHSGKCLGVSGDGTGENASVLQVPCNSTQSRQLANMLDYNTASGVYKYSFASSSTKRLDVSGGSTAAGAGIVQRASSTNTSQQITLLDFGNDTYGLSFNHSGLCLDIPSFSTADNVQAKQYGCNGGANQRVRFIRR
jgi:hypothetical protein